MVCESDLSNNFFAREEDIGNNSRADITQRGLMEINYSAIVMIYKGELSNDFSILNDIQLLIITELINIEDAETLNQFCRNKKIGFIYTAVFGLSSFFFSDFGEDFIIEDSNGEECERYFVKSITNACPGVVEIDPIETTDKNGEKIKKYLKLGTGDFVTFKDITGMVELNDTPPRPIYALSPTKFTIEDTTKFQEFTGVGIVEEIKVPRPSIFKPLIEAINSIYYEEIIEDYLSEDSGSAANRLSIDMTDEMLIGGIGAVRKSSNTSIIQNEHKNNNNIPWIKMFYSSYQNEPTKNYGNEKIHLAVLTLHEFLNNHQSLPNSNIKKEIDECIEISEKILSKAKEDGYKWAINLQKKDTAFLEKIFKCTKYYFTPFTCLLGGIITEEIIKYTGLYKPSSQWIYFNVLDLVNDKDIDFDFDDNKNEIIINENNEGEKENNVNKVLFGKEIIHDLKKINILIIGFNDIGYEILKMFIMLGILSKKGNVIIVDDKKSEIDEKINDLKSQGKFHNINIIIEKINDNTNLSEKEWWTNATIVINTLSFNNNEKEKLYVIKNCKKSKKILIDINANKTMGSYELIMPKKLLGNDIIKNDIFFYEEVETPEGPENIEELNNINNDNKKNLINTNKINTDENEEELKYKNISTWEESLNWSKDFFEKNFSLYIKYLIEIVKKSDSEEQFNKFLDNLMSKEKDTQKILNLIRYIKKIISLKLGMNYESIVFHSIETFQELFEFSVEEIIQKYPSDLLVKGNNEKFWSGARKEPKKIIFDINNEEHYQFVYCMTYLLCQIMEMTDIDAKMKNIKKVIEKYEPKQFDSSLLKKVKLKDYYNIEKFSLLQFLKSSNKTKLHFKELVINYKDNNEDFDSLEKMNKQLKLVIIASNIMLSCFGLNEYNRTNAICSVLEYNSYHPMVSSSVSSMVMIQLFNFFNDSKFIDYIHEINNNKNETIINDKEKQNKINDGNEQKISCFKNAIFNLASNIYLLFDLNNS